MKTTLYIPICDSFSLCHGDICEFNGTEEMGKANLLMNIVAHCILPKSLSGCESVVIYITSNKVDILKLVKILEHKLVDQPNRHNLCDAILDRFHLYHCDSPSDCYMALLSLYHFPNNYSDIGAIIIDNYCYLLFEGQGKTKAGNHLDILQKLIQEHNLVLLLSQFPLLLTDGHLKPMLKLVNYRFKLTSYTEDLITIRQVFPETGKSYNFIAH